MIPIVTTGEGQRGLKVLTYPTVVRFAYGSRCAEPWLLVHSAGDRDADTIPFGVMCG